MIFRYKDGQEIFAGDSVSTSVSQDGQCTLIVSKAVSDDAGTYEVEISNESGKLRSSSIVTVAGVQSWNDKPFNFLIMVMFCLKHPYSRCCTWFRN